MKNVLTALALLALSGAAAQAQGLYPVITQTVGTGGEESLLVLDFQDGAPGESSLFGYRYDGTKTGYDMLKAIAAQTSVTFTYVQGFGPTDNSPLGVAIMGFQYQGHAKAGFEPGTPGYWSYWLGDDGVNWQYSGVGASSRVLSNGSYDGWSWSENFRDSLPVTPYAAAVPEAGAGWLVLLALPLALTARRRVRAKPQSV